MFKYWFPHLCYCGWHHQQALKEQLNHKSLLENFFIKELDKKCIKCEGGSAGWEQELL